MVKIRLKRIGAKKRPFYRLVVADARSPRDGKFIEALGFYDPLPDPPRVEINGEKVQEWLTKGARPSDSARRLLQQEGLIARTPYVAPQRTAKQRAIDTAAAEVVAKAEKAEADQAAAEASEQEAAAESPGGAPAETTDV